MFEKVNPSHPDKLADRIAGALVDVAYSIEENPKIAVEVLIGHGKCFIVAETSVNISFKIVEEIVKRIAGDGIKLEYVEKQQDIKLAKNQQTKIRCGDNGIFKGVPLSEEQTKLTRLAKDIYKSFPTDGKYIIDKEKIVICQSNAEKEELLPYCSKAIINPIGSWFGGTDVDTGATNRKLGSDMADSVTGGGLHGKDLSKADVSVNIYAFLKAQEMGKIFEFSCAIGDEELDGHSYSEIVEIARSYIKSLGGFEKFAEWGLVR